MYWWAIVSYCGLFSALQGPSVLSGATATGTAGHGLPPRFNSDDSTSSQKDLHKKGKTGKEKEKEKKPTGKGRKANKKTEDETENEDHDHAPLGAENDGEDPEPDSDMDENIPEDLRGSKGKLNKKPAARVPKKKPSQKRKSGSKEFGFYNFIYLLYSTSIVSLWVTNKNFGLLQHFQDHAAAEDSEEEQPFKYEMDRMQGGEMWLGLPYNFIKCMLVYL